jgi:hypothetical protein
MITMWSSQNDPELRLLRSKMHRVPSHRRRQFRPRLEGLEDRAVLSTLTVANDFDSGAGSLRDTIAAAGSGDTIVFDPSLNGRTITLTSGELALTKSLDIEGPGAGQLAVSGNHAGRVFNISGGVTITIAGLRISDGMVVGGAGGGAILNTGSTLTLSHDVLSNNEVLGAPGGNAQGGALGNLLGATLTVTDSLLAQNQAVGGNGGGNAAGGAIVNNQSATATISDSAFTGNQAIGGNGGSVDAATMVGFAHGGAVFNAATLTVENSEFTGNQALAGSGGSGGRGASVFYLVDVALGGGMHNAAGKSLVMSGTTFSGNQAIGGSDATGGTSGQGYIGLGAGGGLLNHGTAAIADNTFDRNEARGGSGDTGASGFLVVGAGAGGAINNSGVPTQSAVLTASDLVLRANLAIGGAGNTGGAFAGAGFGGAITNILGVSLTLSNSTVSDNQAVSGRSGDGGDALGGGLANLLGASLTVSGSTLAHDQALGGDGHFGGNGLGGGVYTDGLSTNPLNPGTPARLTVIGCTITHNWAVGGAGEDGGSDGQGIGGGLYLADGGIVCIDVFTQAHVKHNRASTSNDNIFGSDMIC